MTIKRLTALLLSTGLLLSVFTGCESKGTEMRDITTMDLVQDMGLGINLGNTFESCGNWINTSSVTNYETAWGSPVITQEMIQGYRAEGFGVLRVPVAWSNMMQEGYTIHPDYLARVKEVVGWALDADLYVILNIHYDSGWWENFAQDKESCMKKYTRIWEQLCEAFKQESDYLMFESLNEEGHWDQLWNRYSGSTDGKAESYGLLNEINQTFVDIVRKSGGNNTKRHLLIAGYATDIDLTCDPLFVMPNDKENRCAVSVHYYTPSTFCILTEDASWGKAQTEWGTDQERAQLVQYMEKLKTHFIDKGIPVIMGEFGVAKENKTQEMIRRFMTAVCKEAYSRDICPVIWDTTGSFYDRENGKFYDQALLADLMTILSSANARQEAA